MSSVLDSGYYNHQGVELEKQKCASSPTKKHEFYKKFGSWPSIYYECKHCTEGYYTK